MKHLPGQKDTSVAWFKLSELIARGECEKALTVFKLLSHSLPDKAYVLQVEGDILWYLDDARALEKYKQAAFLYQKEKRLIDAVSIYEHLFTQRPERSDLLSNLLVTYALLDWPEKFSTRLQIMVERYDKQIVDRLFVEKACQDVFIAVCPTPDSKPKEWLLAALQAQHMLPASCSDLFKS